MTTHATPERSPIADENWQTDVLINERVGKLTINRFPDGGELPALDITFEPAPGYEPFARELVAKIAREIVEASLDRFERPQI